jgi:uncharacterized protein YndB with AHSA1/START domain/DNA-binding transcriptional ArsR family regulator
VDDDSVFRALADPTRRFLLDRLFDRGGRTLTELESKVGSEAEMTRFGVMKHLRVLEDAGLIVTRRSGREKLHYLNPVPIRLIHDRWMHKYAEGPTSALTHLKRGLEHKKMKPQTIETTQIYQVFIKASPERIWDAITKPEHTTQYFHGSHVDAELKPGGKFWYYAPDRSKLWGDGKVLELDPPRRLVTTWHALWDDEVTAEKPSRVIWEIEPQEGGYCKLTVVHDQLEGAPITAKHVSGPGWMFVLSGMKTLVETGRSMKSIPSDMTAGEVR